MAIKNAYGISATPTFILIAPNHDIVEQDMWPISSTQTFINYIEPYGLLPAECADVTANFSSDVTELCGSGTVQFSDMSVGDITTWEWTFEGGDPETSTEQNPTVTYNTVGSWDVTMQPLDVACVFWAPYELTGGFPEGGEYSGPGVTDGMFDPEAAGIGTHLITYAYTSEYGCYNTAEESLMVDACTGIDEVKESEIQVYPNPASDMVHIASKSVMVSVSIYSYTGQLIENVKLSGRDYQFNTTSYPAGVYSIKIETDESVISKRLIIK